MSDEPRQWRWVGEDGAQKTVSEQELIAGLSSETLPHYLLVWTAGWAEWLPVMQVAELAWALPSGKADEPVKPKQRETAVEPPAPPLYRYSVIKRRAASLAPRKAAPKPPAATPSVTAGTESPRSPAVAPRAAPRPAASLEPPTTVFASKSERPPPPEASPSPREPEPKSVEEVDLSSIESSDPMASPEYPDPLEGAELTVDEFRTGAKAAPSSSDARYVPPHAPPRSERPLPSFDEEVPRFPAAQKPPADLSAYANRAARAEKRKSFRPYFAVGGGIGVLIAVTAVYLRSRSAQEPSASAERAVASSSARGSGTGACRTITAATRLADSADPSVPPSFAHGSGSPRMAVGFAGTPTQALGITLDPRTMDRERVFKEAGGAKLTSVVPLAGSGSLRWDAAREGGKVTGARAVEASPPFKIGATTSSIVRITEAGSPEVVWPLPKPEATVPRVVPTQSGFAVTLRSGGKGGSILSGLLDSAGNKRTELVPLQSPGELVGIPSSATGPHGMLIAFAARGTDEPVWSVALAKASPGEVAVSAARFALPPGGPGGEAISPGVAALSSNRWLLAWTEGSSGNRLVRAQVLGADLAPSGPPIDISRSGANAGQGAVFGEGSQAVVLFYVQTSDNQHELWGTSIDCP